MNPIPGKYFLALLPPTALRLQLEEQKLHFSQQFGCQGALRSPAHITLHMPFTFRPDKEERLFKALAAFCFGQTLNIELQNYDCFEPRVIFIALKPNPGLYDMQLQLVQQVKQGLQIFNQADDKRGFHPHLTIAFRDLKKNLFYKAWELYRTKTFSETFNCNSFWLLKQYEGKWFPYREFVWY